MIVFPAIDLRAGHVVRLRQGRTGEQVTYSTEPAIMAARWQAEGATWLHIVDLDAALGEPQDANPRALKEIRSAVGVRIQFGGGLRDGSAIGRAFEAGVDRVIVGTMAVEDLDLLTDVVARFGPDKIVVALDIRDGRIASRGWLAFSNLDQAECGKQLRRIGIRRGIVTDISRDGMLCGIDAARLVAIARETGLSVIVSGGIATLDDLVLLAGRESNGIEGAIVGQALYTGAFSLSEAIKLVQNKGDSGSLMERGTGTITC